MRLPILLLFASACVPVLESEQTDTAAWDWEPPENSWPVQAPPPGLTEGGFYVDQVVPDFRLEDQHGDTVALWQFYGMVTVLDISTMWCSPCQELAESTEHTYQERVEDDFMYVTVLAENIEGQDPSIDDLKIWADYYELTPPVVGDPGKVYSSPAVGGGSFPLVLVIDRDLTVTWRATAPTEAELTAEVDALLY